MTEVSILQMYLHVSTMESTIICLPPEFQFNFHFVSSKEKYF